MAEMATGICTGVGRSIKFFHMSVPIDRTEDTPEEGRVRNGLAAGGRFRPIELHQGPCKSTPVY